MNTCWSRFVVRIRRCLSACFDIPKARRGWVYTSAPRPNELDFYFIFFCFFFLSTSTASAEAKMSPDLNLEATEKVDSARCDFRCPRMYKNFKRLWSGRSTSSPTNLLGRIPCREGYNFTTAMWLVKTCHVWLLQWNREDMPVDMYGWKSMLCAQKVQQVMSAYVYQ